MHNNVAETKSFQNTENGEKGERIVSEWFKTKKELSLLLFTMSFAGAGLWSSNATVWTVYLL